VTAPQAHYQAPPRPPAAYPSYAGQPQQAYGQVRPCTRLLWTQQPAVAPVEVADCALPVLCQAPPPVYGHAPVSGGQHARQPHAAAPYGGPPQRQAPPPGNFSRPVAPPVPMPVPVPVAPPRKAMPGAVVGSLVQPVVSQQQVARHTLSFQNTSDDGEAGKSASQKKRERKKLREAAGGK
jgi:hypothetical protein